MSEKYDVAIIGAGIGGLVCGCYLAKAGLKVIIVEQQNKPGGYCTSFERDGYRFDVGVHYLGGVKRGILGKILSDLNLRDKIKFNQFDPTDKIVFPESTTYVRAKPFDTIEEFKKTFPKERKNIGRFFRFILEESFHKIYIKTRVLTFKDVLDKYFDDFRLKDTLGFLLVNIGVSQKEVSAISAIILYREFLLDPGYYPVGGMDSFASSIANKFISLGGKLYLNMQVSKVLKNNNRVRGVSLNNNKDRIESKFVVSNIDAKKLFKDLILDNTKESTLITKLRPSLSLFVLYLGLRNIKNKLPYNLWLADRYGFDNYFLNINSNTKKGFFPYSMISSPSAHDIELKDGEKQTLQYYLVLPYMTRIFWSKNTKLYVQKILSKLENLKLIARSQIDIQEIAIPMTFEKFTLNQKGAAFGWKSTLAQTDASVFPQKTSIKNLFLVGHWCTIGTGQGGVSRVALSGLRGSKLIMNTLNQK